MAKFNQKGREKGVFQFSEQLGVDAQLIGPIGPMGPMGQRQRARFGRASAGKGTQK